MKFSEDIVALNDLKQNPGGVVRHTTEVHRPVLLTNRSQAVAVMQSVADFQKGEAERTFMRAVVAGLADIESGREVSMAEAKSRLGVDTVSAPS